MSDSFPLFVLSFFLILHNVCSWSVSEPLNQTMNHDGSISVTCMFEGQIGNFELEAKLKMNDKHICEIYENNQGQAKHDCTWKQKGTNFTFTWLYPEHIHKSEFSCEISKVQPLPVKTMTGPRVKLFQGCTNSVAPQNRSCSCDDPTHIEAPPVDKQMIVICILLIAVMMLSVYSIIITGVYFRLRWSKKDSDTLTYVPMQKNVKRRVPDNTEYMDMREVQKRGSHRDMNHNSHMVPSAPVNLN